VGREGEARFGGTPPQVLREEMLGRDEMPAAQAFHICAEA
jgi:hypothetical protein